MKTGQYDIFGFEICAGDTVIVYDFTQTQLPNIYIKSIWDLIILDFVQKQGSYLEIISSERELKIEYPRDVDIIESLSLDLEDYLQYKHSHPRLIQYPKIDLERGEWNVKIILREFILAELFGAEWPEFSKTLNPA